ncbi:hypothetical protein GW17_00030907 [Ensete ventricosum]|nr:hypothetical protein GW17_00030907 [Ensete ventricosum]RZS24521.1 hypothetical protein BHM03_00057598 [Ensete ventricosum]
MGESVGEEEVGGIEDENTQEKEGPQDHCMPSVRLVFHIHLKHDRKLLILSPIHERLHAYDTLLKSVVLNTDADEWNDELMIQLSDDVNLRKEIP